MENINNQIIIYQTEDGNTAIDVRLENETVWLNTTHMSMLFNREESNIRRHILNIFNENELDRENNVHFLHVNGVKKPVPFYSLDVIISVGYRVKSRNGTLFRIWANRVLKEYLVKGFAVRNKLTERKYKELNQMVQLLGRTIESHRPLTSEDYDSLFQVVSDYAYALQVLDRYDYQQLTMEATTSESQFHATYENAMETIMKLKERFSESTLFGNEKDGSFKSSIGQIYQTFDGQELYPSVEEKAAMVKVVVNLINQKN